MPLLGLEVAFIVGAMGEEEEEEDMDMVDMVEALVVEAATVEALEDVEVSVVDLLVEEGMDQVVMAVAQEPDFHLPICHLLNQVSKFLSRIFLGQLPMKTW